MDAIRERACGGDQRYTEGVNMTTKIEEQIHDFLINNKITYTEEGIAAVSNFVSGMTIPPKVFVDTAELTELEKSQRMIRLSVIISSDSVQV